MERSRQLMDLTEHRKAPSMSFQLWIVSFSLLVEHITRHLLYDMQIGTVVDAWPDEAC